MIKTFFFSNSNMMFFKFSGNERPDIQQLGILTFATIVHNAFSVEKLSESSFDKYAKTFFNLFLGKR